MRLTAVEKLARRMCWVEFVGYRPPVGEARYWRELPDESRQGYVDRARHFARTLSKLQAQETSYQMVCDAQIECWKSWGKKEKS